MTGWAGAAAEAGRVQKGIEAAGFRVVQSYLAAAGLCPHYPVADDQPPTDPSYTCACATAGGGAQATFSAEYTEGPINYQLSFECFEQPYGSEKLVVLLIALSDVSTWIMASFASLRYEEFVMIYNTPNVNLEALPPTAAHLQNVLAFLLDPDMEPGGCRAAGE
jgi:hypothetical protein